MSKELKKNAKNTIEGMPYFKQVHCDQSGDVIYVRLVGDHLVSFLFCNLSCTLQFYRAHS